MTEKADSLIETFNGLAEEERREVIKKMLPQICEIMKKDMSIVQEIMPECMNMMKGMDFSMSDKMKDMMSRIGENK